MCKVKRGGAWEGLRASGEETCGRQGGARRPACLLPSLLPRATSCHTPAPYAAHTDCMPHPRTCLSLAAAQPHFVYIHLRPMQHHTMGVLCRSRAGVGGGVVGRVHALAACTRTSQLQACCLAGKAAMPQTTSCRERHEKSKQGQETHHQQQQQQQQQTACPVRTCVT